MRYFLLAAMVLLYTLSASTPGGATVIVSSTATVLAGETFANSWAMAGPAPAAPAGCNNGYGILSHAGSLVECPTGATIGVMHNPIPIPENGDRAKSAAWAQISGGIGTVSASTIIPLKPQAFAAAAAYAKANAAVPKEKRDGKRIGGTTLTIIYGNLKLTGWSEPVDVRTYIIVDSLSPGQLPEILTKILDKESIASLENDGYEITKPDKVFFSVEIVSEGHHDRPLKVTYNSDRTCEEVSSTQENLPTCVISKERLSDSDFKSCKSDKCRPHEMKKSLTGMHKVAIKVAEDDMPEYFSVHEITCAKSRTKEFPKQSEDICNLQFRAQQQQQH